MMKEHCICTSLRQAALSSTAYYDDLLKPSGLKVTMFRLMRRIGERPEITITDLSRIVGLDRSTLGRNLRVLERDGLIDLAAGKDGRARSATLTQAGSQALDRALPLWQTAQSRMKKAIGADLDTLLASLGRLADLSASKGASWP